MSETIRRIITGGPGFGKTSILAELKRLNKITFEEIARIVIKEEMDKESEHLPWLDNLSFSLKVLERQKEQYFKAQGLCYFDRGAADVLAYIKHNKQSSFQELNHFLRNHPYDNKVFITPPWEDIYTRDSERQEDYTEACLIHEQLLNTYTDLGYEVIEIPKGTIEERTSFVLGHE